MGKLTSLFMSNGVLQSEKPFDINGKVLDDRGVSIVIAEETSAWMKAMSIEFKSIAITNFGCNECEISIDHKNIVIEVNFKELPLSSSENIDNRVKKVRKVIREQFGFYDF